MLGYPLISRNSQGSFLFGFDFLQNEAVKSYLLHEANLDDFSEPCILQEALCYVIFLSAEFVP